MQLDLTIPLQRHLKFKNLSCGEPLGRQCCWDLHVITLQGRPSLLAVHCATRYTFTLFDVSAAQWGALQGLWKCNDALAKLNAERLSHMNLHSNLTPAILSH